MVCWHKEIGTACVQGIVLETQLFIEDNEGMAKKVAQTPENADKGIDLSFEEAYRELEQIVARLEKGELSLEQALELHERGQLLAQYCSGQLERAELKIRKLDVTEGESV
jgi:exodeoxyribonuclease VII small subunit